MDGFSKCVYCSSNFKKTRQPAFLYCCCASICTNCYSFLAHNNLTTCQLCNSEFDFKIPPSIIKSIRLEAQKSKIQRMLDSVHLNGLQDKLVTIKEIRSQVEITKNLLKDLLNLKDLMENIPYPPQISENETSTVEKTINLSLSLEIDDFMKIKSKVETMLAINQNKLQSILIERYSLLLKPKLKNKTRILWTSKRKHFKIVESSGPKVISLKLLSKIPVQITGIGIFTKSGQDMTGNDAKVIVKIGNSIFFNEKVDLQMNTNKDCINEVFFDNPIELKPYYALIIEMTLVTGKYFSLDPFEVSRFRGHFFSLSSDSDNHVAYFIFKGDTQELSFSK